MGGETAHWKGGNVFLFTFWTLNVMILGIVGPMQSAYGLAGVAAAKLRQFPLGGAEGGKCSIQSFGARVDAYNGHGQYEYVQVQGSR